VCSLSFILANLGNEKVREAVMDFLTVTHVAEASVPTIKALATFKEGIGLVWDCLSLSWVNRYLFVRAMFVYTFL
jgi:hypothetical protein